MPRDTASFNILIVGVGGQGVTFLSKVIATAAQESHRFVCRTEFRGLSQRGGAVSSIVRLASRPIVPAVGAGQSNLIIALDALEGARAKPTLAASGRLISERALTFPLYWLSATPSHMQQSLKDHVGEQLADERVRLVDASDHAATVGSVAVSNTVLLGVAAWYLPMDREALERSLMTGTDKESHLLNARAFQLGHELLVGKDSNFTQRAS